MPVEIEEAAIIDGASVFQRYYRIALPLALPMISTLGLFIFMGSWNDFFLPLVLSLGNPDSRTLAVGMYAFVGERTRDWTGISAAATISVAPIIILFVFMQRFFIEAFAAAVKS